MQNVILLKMGELVLKGLNRARFEEALLKHVREAAAPFGTFLITARQSTVTVEAEKPDADIDWPGLCSALTKVFGVVGVATAAALPKNMDAIIASAKIILADVLGRAVSFKVEAKRSDKNFPLTSPQISAALGGALHDAFPHLRVDVYHPDTLVVCEIRDRHAYLHAGTQPGAGGLPRGTAGRGVWLLSGGIDSPVAGYMMAKRGLALTPLHFFSYPYTSMEARDKVVSLARILSPYTGRGPVLMAPFTAVQEAIRRSCPEPLGTILTRRFMCRVAGRVAGWYKAACLVTGESLGQVASQTLGALAVTEEAAGLPILRPLIGMDKEEIVAVARKIGSFETSILPMEDCCTVFTPRHPKTNPKLEEILAAEAKLDGEALVRGVLDSIERVRLDA